MEDSSILDNLQPLGALIKLSPESTSVPFTRSQKQDLRLMKEFSDDMPLRAQQKNPSVSTSTLYPGVMFDCYDEECVCRRMIIAPDVPVEGEVLKFLS